MMLAPSFPMSSVDNNHLCPHCAKRFDRRDLKERHRRRCEKSINKVRIAKKRSCESCIASKVKCDLAKPCSRCRNRQTKCEYKIDEVVGHRNRVPQSSPPATAAISSAGSSSAGSSSASSSSTTFDFSGDMLASDSIDGGSLMPTTDFFDPQLWLAQDLVSVMPNGDLSIPMDSLLDPDSLLGSFTQQSSPSQSSPPLTGYLTSSSVHATTPNSSDREIESSLRRYTLTDLGDPSLSVTWKEPNFSEQSSLAFPLALKLQEKHRSQFQTKLPEFLHDMLAIHPPLGPGLIDLERAEKMVADYPAHMLVDTFFSPFVHGRLVQNGMPEPVAIAVACVGMKLHTQLSGMEFVCNVFRVQREKIVAELPTVSQNLEDICAYIHAYSIYQIESLLSPNRYSAPLSSAELHHEYLVKMIRRLSKKYRNILTGEDREDQWEAWTIAETFRRTFYLVLLIHQLLGAREVLMPAYFEPLLSTEDLRSLQLPCTDELWLAQDRTAWCQAYQKEQNRHLSSISVGSMLDSLLDNESLNRGSAEQPPKIDQLGELPRLVISILKHTLDL